MRWEVWIGFVSLKILTSDGPREHSNDYLGSITGKKLLDYLCEY